MQINTDTDGMALALEWAAKGMYITAPNPRVGCVIVRDGAVIGAGHTQPAGQAHAEIQALRDAVSRGEPVRGATAYVTLEPCSHHGRTPPCAAVLHRLQWRRAFVQRQQQRQQQRSAPGYAVAVPWRRDPPY